ncbi:hypothetical protein F5B19DRAFT_315528 [Rostrohypoxylon terebratum]|nr:hypothetical protein F5B19DRAFT_315528 [Rostrohypoxylon terebratum]
MPHPWILLRYPAALLLAAAASGVDSASIARPDAGSLLFSRATSSSSSCGANFSPCSQAGLPANFCCEADATCDVLAANTTVLCCPQGANCDKISPITCDLGLQDPAANPEAEIKTTVLDGVLTACAGQCCPFGYSCDGTNCVRDADQSKRPTVKEPSSSSGSSSQTPSPTATSTHKSTTVAVSGVNTASASASAAPETQTPPTTSTSGTASTVTIIGGVIGGIVGLVLVILAVVMVRHRRKKTLREKQLLQRQETSSSFGNIISNPVPHANYPSQRLDFLAKSHPAESPRSYAPSSPTAVASPRSQKEGGVREGGGFGEVTEYYGHGNGKGKGKAYRYAQGGYMPESATTTDTPRSHHASAEITGLRSLTRWPSASTISPSPSRFRSQKGKKGGNTGNININDNQGGSGSGSGGEFVPPTPMVFVTPASNEDGGVAVGRQRYPSESINIFADPLMVPGGAGGARPSSAATTWSNIQQRADNAMHGTGTNGRLGESSLRR